MISTVKHNDFYNQMWFVCCVTVSAHAVLLVGQLGLSAWEHGLVNITMQTSKHARICGAESVPCPLSTVSGGDTGPLSSWNNDALLFLKEKLKLKVLMNTGLLDRLERAAGGFMSEYEAKTVRELPSNIAQVNRVIEILRGKGDKDFMTFCKMLRDSNQVVWADELERVAEQFKRGEVKNYCRR